MLLVPRYMSVELKLISPGSCTRLRRRQQLERASRAICSCSTWLSLEARWYAGVGMNVSPSVSTTSVLNGPSGQACPALTNCLHSAHRMPRLHGLTTSASTAAGSG